MSKVKRKYNSEKRRRQAEETRRGIAASARRLFHQQGYASTSIASIASDAGVAVQTFCAVFGSKPAVLLALLDEIETEADLQGMLAGVVEAAPDPRLQLRHIVDFNVRLFEGAADMLEILRGAGSADADLASVWRAGEERRRNGQAVFAEQWMRTGVLRRGVEGEEAADVLWALTGPDAYRLFVVERCWPVSRYREWLFDTLKRLLFDE